jgi:Family of unknown function (DUF5927)/Core-2/I-Branching enzyme
VTVGFVMLAHAALHRAAQVARVLASENCPLVIHVDRRVGGREFSDFVRSLSDFDNIHLAPRRRCDWGTWGLVAASRGAAEMLLERHSDIQHVALISGACLPIKPIPDLKAFLANHPDTDFIESVTIGDVPWTKGGLSEERFTLSFPFSWKRQKRLFDIWVDAQRLVRRKRRMPKGLEPHMGSQWWCLSRSTLERVLSDPRRPALDKYFRRVWIPDESYFQSLVRLYATKVESRSLTISKFDFQGKPHVFYDDHLLLLRQSSAFFARKIWPGANRLYRAFLENQPIGTVTKSASAAHIDRTFVQAVTRRTQGRSGLVMASRFPRPGFENGLTAAPYSVFQGLSDIFEDFPGWISSVSGSRAHGHLYDRNRAEFSGGQTGHAGALSDSPKLRDYDPEAFLRNLIWNTRGEHQSFQLSPRDSQGACEFIVQDRNATISVVSGAWALPLLRSGRPVDEVRAEAARLQKIEAAFLSLLRERRARARARIWTLAEFLERPVDPLQQILDDLSGADTHLLTELPVIRPMKGLVEFLQTLRNAGMNPHLAGEVNELLIISPKRAKPKPMRLS